MASPVSPPTHRATFFGPYHHLLSVRVSGRPAHFEECMIASAEAQELEEVLAGVEASVHDLIGAEEAEAMARKT